MDTEFKTGDKVVALCGRNDYQQERDGVVSEVIPPSYLTPYDRQPAYKILVSIAGAPSYYVLPAERLRLIEPPAAIMSQSEIMEVLEREALEEERALTKAKNALPPPAEKPKKERIRRTADEIALGIPIEHIMAYREHKGNWPEVHKAILAQEEAKNSAPQTPASNANAESKTFFEGLGEELNPSEEAGVEGDKEWMLPSTKEQEEMLRGLGLNLMEGAPEYAIYTNYLGTSVWFQDGKIILHYEEDGCKKDCIVLDASNLKGDVETALELTKKSQEARSVKTGVEAITVSNYKEGDPLVTITAVQSDGPVVIPFSQVIGDVEPAKEEVAEPDWSKCMKAIRYDYDYLGPPPDYKIVGRQKVNGQRSYVVLHPDQEVPFFYPSVTTIIDAVIPKDKALEGWAIKEFKDVREKNEFLDMKAAYGTVVHGAIADLVNRALPDFEDYEGWIAYMNIATGRSGHSRFARGWMDGVQRAVVSFVKWMQDYQVRILALEIPLCHRGMGFAGQIDLLVERNAYIQKKSGKHKEAPPRVIAVDDIKTGSASNAYVPQLAMYNEMVAHNYPELKGKIQAHGLFVPQDWRREPRYQFSDKTSKVAAYTTKKMQMHLDLFRQDMKPPRGVQTLVGKPAIDMNLSEVIGWKPLESVWMDKIKTGDFGADDDVIVQEEEDDDESDD